jgi:hypothetical protein
MAQAPRIVDQPFEELQPTAVALIVLGPLDVALFAGV